MITENGCLSLLCSLGDTLMCPEIQTQKIWNQQCSRCSGKRWEERNSMPRVPVAILQISAQATVLLLPLPLPKKLAIAFKTAQGTLVPTASNQQRPSLTPQILTFICSQHLFVNKGGHTLRIPQHLD